jgi:hypothetical protein
MSDDFANYFLEFIPRYTTNNPSDTEELTIFNNSDSVGIIAFSIPDLSFTTQGTVTKQLIVPEYFFDQSSHFMWSKPRTPYKPKSQDIVRIFIGQSPEKKTLLTVCSISQEVRYDPATRLYTIQLREIITEGEDKVSYIANTGKKKLNQLVKEIMQQQNNTEGKFLNRGGYASYQFNVAFGSDYSPEEKNSMQVVSFNASTRTLRELRSLLLKRSDIFMFIEYIDQTVFGISNLLQQPSTLIDITLQKQRKKDGVKARPIYRIDDSHIINIVENIDYNNRFGVSVQNQRQNNEISPRVPITRQYYFTITSGSGSNKQNHLFFSDLHVNLLGQYGFHELIQAPNFQNYLTSDEYQKIILAFESNDTNKISNASNIIQNTLNRIADTQCKEDVYRTSVYDVTLPGTLIIDQKKHSMITTKSELARSLILNNNPSKTELYWKVGMSVELDISSIKDENNNSLFSKLAKDMVIIEIKVVSNSSNATPEQNIILSLGADLSNLMFSANSILTTGQKQILKNKISYLSNKNVKDLVLSNYNEQRNNVIDEVLAAVFKKLDSNGNNFLRSTTENDFYETQRKLRNGF